MPLKDLAKRKEFRRKYYLRNRTHLLALAREQGPLWVKANPDKVKEIQKRHRASPKRKAWESAYYARPEIQERLKAYRAKHFRANREKVYANRRRNIKAWVGKCETEGALNYKIHCKLGSRMSNAIKRHSGVKAAKTMELIGCTVIMVRAHLESLFKPGMSWENYGKWHVDHIIPCAEFDLRQPEQQLACFNWKNLQPLWGAENIAKGAKYQKQVTT